MVRKIVNHTDRHVEEGVRLRYARGSSFARQWNWLRVCRLPGAPDGFGHVLTRSRHQTTPVSKAMQGEGLRRAALLPMPEP